MATPPLAYRAQPLVLYLDDVFLDPIQIGCIKETHTKSNILTDHPVEVGFNVTDHSRPEPDVVVLECVVSKTRPPATVIGPYVDPDALWRTLDNLHNTPVLIRAITMGGDYQNMGITSVSRMIDVKSANAVQFTLSLKKVRVVQNQFTTVVKSAVTRAHPVVKQGPVTTTSEAPDIDPLKSAKAAVTSFFFGGK